MPMQLVVVEVSAGSDAFTEQEAREFVLEALSRGTDVQVGRVMNWVSPDSFIPVDDDDAEPVRVDFWIRGI